MISGSGDEGNTRLFVGPFALPAEAGLWTEGTWGRGVGEGKEYVFHVPVRQRPCGDLYKTTLLPDCSKSYKTPWFNWEKCISTQVHAGRKDDYFHAALTWILSTYESSSHAQLRPKWGNNRESQLASALSCHPSMHTPTHIWMQDFLQVLSSSGFIWVQAALVKITLCSRTENKMSRQTKHLHFHNILKSSGVNRDGLAAKGPCSPAWLLDGWV